MAHMEEVYRDGIADHGATLATHVSLHSAYPATSGNELAVTREAITWDNAADGVIEATSVPHEFSVPGSVTVGAIAFWNAATDGAVQGSDDVTDETFNDPGTYRVTLLRITHAS